MTNSVLSLRPNKKNEIDRVASWLRAHDFEVLVSSTTERVILATNARPRTLRKARAESTQDGVDNFMKMLASVGGQK